MLHSFATPEFKEGETFIEQTCLNCGTRSIVYSYGRLSRKYYNQTGKITANAPSCLKPRLLHNFISEMVPIGDKEMIQTCRDCGKQRVVYASGSTAYFDEATGARIPYPTACSTRNAKVVSIAEFVKSNQVDNGKFIEAIFILKSVQQDGLTERTVNMIDTFLDSQECKEQELAKSNGR